MAKKAVTFDTVRRIGLTLPGVEQSTAYGSPALRVRGKLLACIPVHRSAEPDSFVVSVDLNDRAMLLAEAPGAYYITGHYAPYETVLVRLSQVSPDQVRDVLGMAHKFVSRKSARKPITKSRARSRSRLH